ncbi:uncharacterized protein NECHADRAFT_84187 [Fusarium vanettenii 77-13-4]|uniref:Heterokaryon incompatibility domain-containing protein n=1 Tax=Fusarium vanettenii (strain ATCC MYA-4622 / CBS 123669 / FGSC 9596 / NRRL 45880 / 77-13-4) TaxID=660122 RepID=C7YZY6_FUSV7|nr:uncharacterized protein NECHADRAFT_84187 [Fusarium vanettenii 77-13-4]EEU42694.1 hypothetical protein NECHADRAFT_84187 [Fusarium vanettenii 77-13-4]
MAPTCGGLLSVAVHHTNYLHIYDIHIVTVGLHLAGSLIQSLNGMEYTAPGSASRTALYKALSKAFVKALKMASFTTSMAPSIVTEKIKLLTTQIPPPQLTPCAFWSALVLLQATPPTWSLLRVQMTEYQYSPIPHGKGVIRLLRLLKGFTCERVHCELFEVAAWKPGDITYEALSYTWGTPPATTTPEDDTSRQSMSKDTSSKDSEPAEDITLEEITIQNRSGPSTMKIKPNLHSALRYLRGENQDRILWADAICINQLDAVEKGDQIGQMRYIYENAEQVLVWLGQGDEMTDKILGSIHDLHEEASARHDNWKDPKKLLTICGPIFRQRLELTPTNEYCKQLEALQELFKRPWFQRIWILQEIASARAATIVCGSKSVPGYIFALMPSILGLEIDDHTQAILDIMPGKQRSQSWWSDRRDLHFLLKKFAACQATEARDKVLALLGISSDASSPEVFRPDCQKTLQGVCRDTLCFLLFGRVLPSSVITLPNPSISELVDYLDDIPRLSHWTFKWAVHERHDLTSIYLLEVGGYTAPFLTVGNLIEHGGHLTLIMHLFSNNLVDEASTNRSGERILNIAARMGDVEVVRFLLGRPNTQLNHRDNDNLTPLAIAIIHGHFSVVELLLAQRQVDVAGGGVLGTTPISLPYLQQNSDMTLALNTGNRCMVEEVLRGKRLVQINRALLAIMARDNNKAGLKALISRGVHYNSRDRYGRTPMMRAAMNGCISTLQILATEDSHGFVPRDDHDFEGRTALSYAAETGELSACYLLMLRGADIDKKDHGGKSPRDWAQDKVALHETWITMELDDPEFLGAREELGGRRWCDIAALVCSTWLMVTQDKKSRDSDVKRVFNYIQRQKRRIEPKREDEIPSTNSLSPRQLRNKPTSEEANDNANGSDYKISEVFKMFRKSPRSSSPKKPRPSTPKKPSLRRLFSTPDKMETPTKDETTPIANAESPPAPAPPVDSELAKAETFSMEQIRRARNPIMNIAVRGTINRFSLEFFLLPGERRSRSHVLVELDEKIRFRDSEGNVADIKGLAMWMKNVGDEFDGELHVRYVVEGRHFVEPLARFQFPLVNATKPVSEHVTTIDVINVLQGLIGELPAIHRKTLTQFTFRLHKGRLLGCRDAVTQWMIRLNLAGMVGWHYTHQEVENVEYIGRQAVSGRGFDTMIDQNFASDMVRDEWGYLSVIVKISPVCRAIWQPNTYRVIKHAGKDLPYMKDENDKVVCTEQWIPNKD